MKIKCLHTNTAVGFVPSNNNYSFILASKTPLDKSMKQYFRILHIHIVI